MKKAFYFVAFISLSVSLIIAGYAAGGEYFPTREGFTKEFSVVVKQGQATRVTRRKVVVAPKTNLNGVEVDTIVITLRKPSGEPLSRKAFYLENDQGVKEIADQGPQDSNPKTLDCNEWTLKYPLAVGATWTSIEEVQPLKEKLLVPFTCVIETMDDVVTVPAGTFERCMKVKKSFSGKVNLGSYGGNPEVRVESYIWYASVIGFIKVSYLMKCSDTDLGGGELHMEMISYKN